jgi:peptidylprolyl isomerase
MSRARGLLAAGALAGLALATVTLVRGGAEAPLVPRAAGDPVAWIDGEPVSQETFARFAGGASRSGGTLDLDGPQRRALLDRLIDEELLLREGLALGLPRNEPGIRRAIVSAVIDGVTSAPGEREPSRRELETLYAETRERWLQPGPVHAEAARVPVAAGSGATVDTEARARAIEIATRARAGESFGALADELGEPLDRPLPASSAPVPVLREHLPTSAVEALLALEPGGVSDPLRSADGWWVVRLVARSEPEAPPLDSLRAELRDAWIRRQHDERLREHVAALRARAEIRVAGEGGD